MGVSPGKLLLPFAECEASSNTMVGSVPSDEKEPRNEAAVKFRDVAPAVEMVCWIVVILALFLRAVNGPSVTDDQFVLHMGVVTTAIALAVGLRIFNWREARSLANLHESWTTIYVALDKPRTARRVVVLLLAIQTGLLGYSAYVHSPTLNEPAHLVAGLSHWKFGRFELYRVNPPLVRMIAALPVMAAGYEENWSGFHEGSGARPVFRMGEEFIAANGPRSLFLVTIARWICIPFSWLGAVVCYLWARDLYGRVAGLAALSLWCFEPNILAHASLVTADAHATALGLAACYMFWRWLRNPTWTRAVLSGVVLGLAELTKTTLVLFFPLWPLLWIAYRWHSRAEMPGRSRVRDAGMFGVCMAAGLYVVNLGYGFEGSFKPLGEYQFVSKLFTDETIGIRLPSNRFSNTLLSGIPVPFPKHYLLGIDIQQRDFESYGRPSYLRGEWHEHGWWYYYFYAALIKMPLGIWGLMLLCLLFPYPAPHKDSPRDTLLLIAPPMAVFFAASAKTGFSEHFRYVLPAFPFVFIALSRLTRHSMPVGNIGNIFNTRPVAATMALFVERRLPDLSLCVLSTILLMWAFASSLWIYPHSLSYFNEAIGGPLNGANHLLGSNIDWGQDLTYLQQRIAGRDGLRLVSLSYLGGFQPQQAGLLVISENSSGRSGQNATREMCYAVSASLQKGYPQGRFAGDSKYFATNSRYNVSRPSGSAVMIGYSIRLYHMPRSLRSQTSKGSVGDINCTIAVEKHGNRCNGPINRSVCRQQVVK